MFIKNVFFSVSTNVFSVGLSFVVSVILARMLTPTDRGIMVLVMTIPWTVASIASLGLQQSSVYLIGRKKLDASRVWGNTLVMSFILGVVVVLLLNIYRTDILDSVLDGMPDKYWLPLMILSVIILLDGTTLSVLQALQRFDLVNFQKFVSSVLMLVGYGGVLILARAGLSGAIWTYIIVITLMMILSGLLAAHLTPFRLTFDFKLTRESFRFGLKAYTQALMSVISYRIDVLLLAVLLTPEQVAYYGVATSVAETAWHIPNTIGTVLFSRLSHVDDNEVYDITAKVCRNTFGITAIIIVGLFICCWVLVPLVYGSAYTAAIAPLVALLPGVLFMSIFKVLVRNFSSRDRQAISILGSSVSMILNVGLNLLLIPVWGIVGSAVASSTSYIIASVILLFFFLRDSQLPWQDILVPRRSELVGHLHWAKERIINRWQKAPFYSGRTG
ncbi:MAG: hypothetical protein CL610_12910 [Anaerolineaceae bacterium]|nr:hypothetical protein [Anaerolineaceae bacterium]